MKLQYLIEALKVCEGLNCTEVPFCNAVRIIDGEVHLDYLSTDVEHPQENERLQYVFVCDGVRYKKEHRQ